MANLGGSSGHLMDWLFFISGLERGSLECQNLKPKPKALKKEQSAWPEFNLRKRFEFGNHYMISTQQIIAKFLGML